MVKRLSFLLFLMISVFTISGVNANSLNTPEITSFEPSTIENNALKVSIKSNNTGTNYSYELFNITTNKEINLGGAVTSYTFQKLSAGVNYQIQIRACLNTAYSCSNWSTVKSASINNGGGTTPTPTPKPTPSPQKGKVTTDIVSYTFNNVGKSVDIDSKASNGKKVTYSSSNTSVATVTSTGKITAKKAGSAVITSSASDCDPAKTTIIVPSFRSREAALDKWRHTLIDTYFYIFDRKYGGAKPYNYYWKNGVLKTGSSGNRQTCVTLPNVSAKRLGFFSSGWVCTSNGCEGTSPNGTVKSLKKNSKYVTVKYPKKSLQKLHNSGEVLYGDILGRAGHVFVYMGSKSRGLKVYQSGGHREIGGGASVYWKNGKKSGNFSKVRDLGKKWRNGKIADSAFKGVSPSKKSSKIHVLVRPNVYKIYTSCTNGTITQSNLYMAAQNYTINYAPRDGYKLSKITVDGKNVSTSTYKNKYTFKKLAKNHTIHVTYVKK